MSQVKLRFAELNPEPLHFFALRCTPLRCAALRCLLGNSRQSDLTGPTRRTRPIVKCNRVLPIVKCNRALPRLSNERSAAKLRLLSFRFTAISWTGRIATMCASMHPRPTEACGRCSAVAFASMATLSLLLVVLPYREVHHRRQAAPSAVACGWRSFAMLVLSQPTLAALAHGQP